MFKFFVFSSLKTLPTKYSAINLQFYALSSIINKAKYLFKYMLGNITK